MARNDDRLGAPLSRLQEGHFTTGVAPCLQVRTQWVRPTSNPCAPHTVCDEIAYFLIE